MYAVVKSGSRQYRVKESDEVDVERLPSEAGTEVTLKEVLLLADGENILVGRPYLDGVSVLAEVQGHCRGPKVVAFKYRRRKDSRSKKGHRQDSTRLKIKKIIH